MAFIGSTNSGIEVCPDRVALAAACAQHIAEALAQAIAARGRATAVISGGSTPGPIYDRLARSQIDWRKVTLTLSDERWVPIGHADANETMVRARLLTGLAQGANFSPMKYAAPDPETGADAAAEAVCDLFPTDITFLGMGEDGHIASLFPGDAIVAATEELDAPLTISVPLSPTEPCLPRISLTLRALLDTSQIVLAVTGEAKRVLIERVLAEPAYAPPVAALIRQRRVPVRIFWAP